MTMLQLDIPMEHERRFLVFSDDWRGMAICRLIRQGYLLARGRLTVRVRCIDERGELTLKRPHGGISRIELEYEIPYAHAEYLLYHACRHPPVEKRRHRVVHAGLSWDVDEFLGNNLGLVVAEAELASPDQHLSLPSWLGPEITADRRFSNSRLYRRPFAAWPAETVHLLQVAKRHWLADREV